MYRPRIKFAVIVAVLFSIDEALFFSIANAQSLTDQGVPATSPVTMLRHDLKPQLLRPELKPGDIFDSDVKDTIDRQIKYQGHWHKVPEWLAGTWRVSQDGQVLLAPHKPTKKHPNVPPAEAYAGFSEGVRMDEAGQVWSKDAVGEWQDDDDKRTYSCFVSYKESQPDATKRISQSESLGLQIDKAKRITTSLRGTIEQSVRYISPDQIEIIKVSQSFDWQGNPLTYSEWTATYRRVGPFQPTKETQGPDDTTLPAGGFPGVNDRPPILRNMRP